MTANVEIYIWCVPFCIRAKALLDGKGVDYTEYNLDGTRRTMQNLLIDLKR
jgi:glutaredoxin 3